MLVIKNYTAVKSFKEFIDAHNIKKTQACVDDGTANYKILGYKVNDFFFVPRVFNLEIYMYKDKEYWVVQ